MRKLIVTWQDKRSRKWYPVGQLVQDSGLYRFFYLNGARIAKTETGFEPMVSFPDFTEIYESVNLFAVFMNRVMPPSRPEYSEIINYLNLPENQIDPFAFLERTGGAKVTDTFELFPCPILESNWYKLSFFVHGLRYMPDSANERISNLRIGDPLFLALDIQNVADTESLLIHTEDYHNVGYCPSYLLDDLREVKEHKDVVKLSVERVNNGMTPLQFRLLCQMRFKKSAVPSPFSSQRFQPISSKVAESDICEI